MEHISISLVTETPALAGEFSDVLKLFFILDSYSVNEKAPGEKLVQVFQEKKDAAVCTFTFREMSRTREIILPEDPVAYRDEEHLRIVRKRLIKRLCKSTLYQLLKALTGLRPPWGSLTGIRPTRLIYESMAQGRSMADSKEWLCREFDVTPDKADLLGRIIEQQLLLPKASLEEADVYISIPFCRTRCAYCSFPGEAVGKGKQIPPYLAALFEEMEAGAAIMKERGLGLRALYVGGGTPSALNEEDFEKLIAHVFRLFPGACEYTVEAGRPDTITRHKLEVLKEYGVGRISINPQTMNDETLRIIGRDHTVMQTVEAYEMAREISDFQINMDVIAGLPGERLSHFEHTMEWMRKLAPDSLTVHTLAIKRSSRLNLEKWAPPDGECAAHMTELGEETAAFLGMKPYYLYRQKYMAGQQQNVGYALPGMACLYNVDIMEETMSILAMGAGAISKRVFPDRELRIERAPNVSNVAVYVDRIQEMIQRKRTLFQ